MENERKVLICPKCGSEIEISENQTLGHCTFCDSLTPLPFFITNKEGFDSETYKNMLNRVNKAIGFSLTYQFHRAYNLYDKLIKKYYNLDVEDYYPYFGKVLAQYGVCYAVNDKLENELVCLKIVKESIFENENYLRAIELSDINTEAVLKQIASQIDIFQKETKKELIKAEPIDVCILVDDRDINPNLKADVTTALRIQEKLNTLSCKSCVTTNLFGPINKEFVVEMHKKICIADHLVVVSTDNNHLNDSLFRHVWMSFFTDVEVHDSIIDRMSIVCDDFSNIESLPIAKLSFFKTVNLTEHFEYLTKALKNIIKLNDEFKEKMPKYDELRALLEEKQFDKVKDILNLVLKQAPLDYIQWWIMFLAKHHISKMEDIDNKAINLTESYYFQKAFITAPRFVKRNLHAYYIKCNEALEKLAFVDEEYDKEVEVQQKSLYKKELIKLCLNVIPVIISTFISYWTLSIANVLQIILLLIVNGIGYFMFLKQLIRLLSIGRIHRSISTKDEEFQYIQQIKRALKPQQAAKFLPGAKTKKLHLAGYIILGVCLVMTFSFLVKETVVKIKNNHLNYYYVFNEVVVTGGNGNEIIIPKTINNREVTRISAGAFKSNKKIEKLIISNGIKEIGSKAFSDCQNLKNVTIPASIEKMGTAPFEKCVNLEQFLYQGTYFTPSNFLGVNYKTEMFSINYVSGKTE